MKRTTHCHLLLILSALTLAISCSNKTLPANASAKQPPAKQKIDTPYHTTYKLTAADQAILDKIHQEDWEIDSLYLAGRPDASALTGSFYYQPYLKQLFNAFMSYYHLLLSNGLTDPAKKQ